MIYLVVYNDCYGNGNKSNEGYVHSEEEFETWRKKRNKWRKKHGECEEHREEFDLIPLSKLEFNEQ